METTSQLLALIGKTGTEKAVLLWGTIYPVWQYEDFCETVFSAKDVKKARKEAIFVTMEWTWKRQSCRFTPEGWGVVKSDSVMIYPDGRREVQGW